LTPYEDNQSNQLILLLLICRKDVSHKNDWNNDADAKLHKRFAKVDKTYKALKKHLQ